jgi:hypothetical protein
MAIFLILAGVVLGFAALVVFGSSQTVFVQIIGGIIAVCGAVLFAAGAIIDSVDKLRKIVDLRMPPQLPKPRDTSNV